MHHAQCSWSILGCWELRCEFQELGDAVAVYATSVSGGFGRREFNVPAYNEEKHTGVIRNVMVRRGHYSGEVMVVLITRTKKLKGAAEISAKIQEQCPDVVSVQQNINPDQTNVILGKTTKVMIRKTFNFDFDAPLTGRSTFVATDLSLPTPQTTCACPASPGGFFFHVPSTSCVAGTCLS